MLNIINYFCRIVSFKHYAASSIVMLCFLFNNGIANATYIVAISSGDVFVMGADSRETHDDGSTDDDVCKLTVVNDHTVVSAVGYINYFVEPAPSSISIINIEKKLIEDGNSIKDAAQLFGNQVERLLVEGNSPIPGRQTVGIFGGFDNDKPEFSAAYIGFDNDTNKYKFYRLETKNDLNIFFTPQNKIDIHKIVIGDAYRTNALRKYINVADALASRVAFVVKEVIDSHQADNIGGVPSVIILEKGKRPRWYAKTQSCPDAK